jgi:phospholipid/cholesterol/gamma-HCH transport system permease protein
MMKKLTSLEAFVYIVGDASLMFLSTLKIIFTHPPKIKHILKQMEEIGVNAAILIAVTAFFTGGVLIVETYSTFHKFNADYFLGAVVAVSLARELSPVLVALLVISRSGSAMAANIGTMRITEQIDALEVMATNPLRYLIAPRLIAAMVMVPALTLVSIFSGVIGGYFVAVDLYHVNGYLYWQKMVDLVDAYDILGGVYKSIVFGLLLTVVSCYFGYTAKGGAEGVGEATTKAVVTSSVLVLIVDYFITELIF